MLRFPASPPRHSRGVSTSADRIDLLLSRDADDRRSLAEAARRGALLRIRRGVYADPAKWALLSLEERYACRARGLSAVAPQTVLSHLAAGVVHGLPLPGGLPARIHVTATSAPDGRSHPERAMHYAPLPAADVVTVHGVLATSPARTVVDVARVERFAFGLAVADSALRQGIVTADELWDQHWDANTRYHARRVERVIGLADAQSESVGESVSRAQLIDFGFPRPVLQADFRDRGSLIGRVDFWWPDASVIGEFDGAAKYTDDRLRSGLSAAEVVLAEKRREDALRRRVSGFARWSWADALDARRLVSILESAGLRRAR